MPITVKQVDVFERLRPQLQAVQTEMGALSKSKPDNPINKFKLKHINQILEDANALLGSNHRPLKDFTLFDDSDLPSNSDVVFVLTQYLQGLEGWRSSNVKKSGYEYLWDVTGNARIDAEPPSRFDR